MPARESNGLRFLDQLLIGYDELQWAQDERDARIRRMLVGTTHEAGWVGQWVGPSANFGWQIEGSTSGVLSAPSTSGGVDLSWDASRPDSTLPLVGIDRAGNVLEIVPDVSLKDEDGEPLVCPDDSTWYTLVARYATTQREPGTLTLTGGSSTVVGVGTQFTRYNEPGGVGPASKLRIDTTDTGAGNEGTYTIASITDDTHLTLTANAPATETGVRFRGAGRFYSGSPADPDLHRNAVIAWELVTRTTTRPTDGALITADVMRTGTTVTVIDRRRANLWRPYRGTSEGVHLVPAGLWYGAQNVTNDEILAGATVGAAVISAAGAYGIAVDLAPSAAGSDLTGIATDHPVGMLAAALFYTGTTTRIDAFEYVPSWADAAVHGEAGRWKAINGSTVTIATAAGIQDVALVAVPSGSGATHLCFYVDSSGNVQKMTSANNGATWSGPTLVLNPTGAETVSRVDAHLTRLGRIVLALKWSTSTAIRSIYSDDLGTTWSTNSDAGYAIGGVVATTLDVAITEDDLGNLWTVAGQGATNGVIAFRGAAEGSPVPDADELTSAGWKVGPDYSSTRYARSVNALALGDGCLLTTCEWSTASAYTTPPAALLAFVSAKRYPLTQHVLVDTPVESVGVGAHGLGVDAGGLVHVVWLDTDAGGDVSLSSMRFAPVTTRRPSNWYGGT